MRYERFFSYVFFIFTAMAVFDSGCLESNTGDMEQIEDLGAVVFNTPIKINPEYMQVLPFLSAAILNNDWDLQMNENGLTFRDISLFSSEVALSLWCSAKTVFVVDSYANALRMVTPSKLMGAPILVYGQTTKCVLDKIQPLTTIVVGNLDVIGDVFLTRNEDILRYTADIIGGNKIKEGYISVVNISIVDTENTDYYNFPGMAELGSFLCAYRNGMLIMINNSFDKSQIKDRVFTAVDFFDENITKMEYLCIVGNLDVIPACQTEVIIKSNTGEWPRTFFTDNFYTSRASELEDMLVPEFAAGRISVNTAEEFMRLIDVYRNRGFLEENWKKRALIYDTTDSEFSTSGSYSIIHLTETLCSAGFDTTVKTHILCEIENPQKDLEESNFAYILTDEKNGERGGIIIDNLSLNPSTIFDTTGFSGLDGNFSESKNIPRKIFKAGAAAYIAPAGSAIHTILVIWLPEPDDITGVAGDDSSTRLARLFFEELVMNKTVGEALAKAKEKYMEKADMNIDPGASIMTVCEYMLYGDPAFNPYEPRNEGAA